MKKILLATIFSLVTLVIASAQVTIGDATMTLTGFADEELYGETTIINDTDETLELRWVRTINSMPDEWDNYFCAVPGTCGLPWTDSLDFDLPPAADTTGLLQCHCEPEEVAGMASITLNIINNANEEVIGTVEWICDAAVVSTNELEKANIKLYPNPAIDHFKLVNGEKVDQIAIYNILGRQVKYFENKTDDIFVGDLAKGIYLVQLVDLDTNATKTLKLKKN